MKPVDFDNTRRHLQIMLRGQELTKSQAVELCDILTARVDFAKYAKNPTVSERIKSTSPEVTP